jgi:hypothetical protein
VRVAGGRVARAADCFAEVDMVMGVEEVGSGMLRVSR